MKIFLLAFEFFISAALIITVLLHTAKGEGLGGIGAPARLFGHQKGMEAGLDRLTGVLAILFLITALALSLFFQ